MYKVSTIFIKLGINDRQDNDVSFFLSSAVQDHIQERYRPEYPLQIPTEKDLPEARPSITFFQTVQKQPKKSDEKGGGDLFQKDESLPIFYDTRTAMNHKSSLQRPGHGRAWQGMCEYFSVFCYSPNLVLQKEGRRALNRFFLKYKRKRLLLSPLSRWDHSSRNRDKARSVVVILKARLSRRTLYEAHPSSNRDAYASPTFFQDTRTGLL